MKPLALFNDSQFYRSLFTLALPMILQSVVNSLVNMLDTVMIGRLGAVEIASVGLGNQFFFLFNMFLFGVCSGGGIFTAQFWGKQDIPGVKKNVGLCLVLALAMGVIFTVVTALFASNIIGIYSEDPAVRIAGGKYLRVLTPSFIPYAVSFVFANSLRATEQVRLPMMTTMIALSINLVLNYLLIFGAGPIPAFGVEGAAAATVVARITETIILVSVSYARGYKIAGKLREFLGFNAPFMARFFRIAAPVIGNEIIWSLGVNSQNLIMARTGTFAIAAFNITGAASQLTWVLFMGMGNAAGVLIGKTIGEGNEIRARDYASRIARFAPLVACAAALVLIPLSRLLPFIFRVSPEVFAITNATMLILAATYPLKAFNLTMIIGVCRAGGDTIFCAIYDLIFMWLIALPLATAASFIFHAPVWVIYLCIVAEEPFKTLLGIWRLRSGKWFHDVTR